MARTKSITRITRAEFRRLAEIAKQQGMVLDLCSFEEIGCLGVNHRMVGGVAVDARNPYTRFSEQPFISVAEVWPASYMAEAFRPEMDWDAVPRERAHEFVLWHEIGHSLWNFPAVEVEFRREEYDQAFRYKVRKCNEILADRFAWLKLFPDAPLVLRKGLTKSEKKAIESDIRMLTSRFGLEMKKRKPLPVGQYRFVSWKMLESERGRSFIGPAAVERRRAEEWDGKWRSIVFTTYNFQEDDGRGREEVAPDLYRTREEALSAAMLRKTTIGGIGYHAEPAFSI